MTSILNLFKTKHVWTFIFMLIPLVAYSVEYEDGDTFDAQTIENATLTYKVLSANNKTASVRKGANVSKITIPETINGLKVVQIGTESFENCTNLLEVVIPNTVTEIKTDAFRKCGFTSFTLPKNVVSIHSGILGSCPNLESITVESENPVYDSRDNCNGIIETATNTLVFGYERTNIPTSVTSIGEDAFSISTAIEYEIPSHVVTISDYAFYKCGMTSITIPASVQSIGKSAFYGCQALTRVVSKIQTPFGIDSNTFVSYNYATLYVPKGTKAHYESTAGWNLFETITETDEEPSATASDYVNGIYYNFDLVAKTAAVTKENSKFKYYGDIEIPDTVEYEGVNYKVNRIKGDTFMNSYITSISIPSTIDTIGLGAFYGCYDLTAVYISDLKAWCNIEFRKDGAYYSNPLYFAHHLFLNGEEIQDLVVPEDIKGLKRGVFSGNNFKTVTLHNGIDSIGDYAFNPCDQLEKVITYIKKPFGLRDHSFGRNISVGAAPYYNIKLCVPKGTLSLYRNKECWCYFNEYEEFDISGVDKINVENAVPINYYNVKGNRMAKPQRGLNIVHMNDDSVRKVLVK